MDLLPHNPFDRFSEAAGLYKLLQTLKLRASTNKTYGTIYAMMKDEIMNEIHTLTRLGIHEYQQTYESTDKTNRSPSVEGS